MSASLPIPARAEVLRHGIDISRYRARRVERDDFYRFSHIFALDHANFADLEAIAPRDGRASLSLLLDLVAGREGQAVADPYFGDAGGFAVTWHEVSLAAKALADRLVSAGSK